MKASVSTLSECPTADKSRVAVFCELVKIRLTSLVLLTTLVGFYVGAKGEIALGLLAHTLLGTALLAGGAAALNQFLEREWDAKMDRTSDRPIPSGRLRPEAALWFGLVTTGLGILYLAGMVNGLASAVGAITLISYVGIYTPLKRVTTLNTLVGAVPGALPPLIGSTAARGEFTIEGWAMFGILFFWQLPHFLAIGWMYRSDYAKAGYVMAPVEDGDGRRTGGQAVRQTLGLLPISLFPVWVGMTGTVYFVGAMVLGLLFLGTAVRFACRLNGQRARQLFLASVVYLPMLWGLMVFDKLE